MIQVDQMSCPPRTVELIGLIASPIFHRKVRRQSLRMMNHLICQVSPLRSHLLVLLSALCVSVKMQRPILEIHNYTHVAWPLLHFPASCFCSPVVTSKIWHNNDCKTSGQAWQGSCKLYAHILVVHFPRFVRSFYYGRKAKSVGLPDPAMKRRW